MPGFAQRPVTLAGEYYRNATGCSGSETIHRTPDASFPLQREVRDIPGEVIRRVWNEDLRDYTVVQFYDGRLGTLRTGGDTRVSSNGLASRRSNAVNRSISSGASKARFRRPTLTWTSTPAPTKRSMAWLAA